MREQGEGHEECESRGDDKQSICGAEVRACGIDWFLEHEGTRSACRSAPGGPASK